MSRRAGNAGTLLYLLAFISASIAAGPGDSSARPESVPGNWFHVIQLDESKSQLSAARATLQRSQDQIATTDTNNFFAIAQRQSAVLIDRSA